MLFDAIERTQSIFVEMSAVSYVDSSGVASLVEAFQLARTKQVSFSLVSVNAPVRRVLELARLDRVFTIHETLNDGIGGGA